MNTPDNITNEHIDRAISEMNIDENQRLYFPKTYSLPSKFALGEANKYANNTILSSHSFTAV